MARALVILLLTLPSGSVALGQGEALDISRAQEECFIRVPYPLVEALIRPEREVQVAKVYFRSAAGPHFYAIEMTYVPDPEGFEAVLPVPGPDTAQVIYYVEAITPEFEASRTAEYVVDVVREGECDERLYGEEDPGIVIYATEEGAPALPVGFLAVGVAAAVSAAGVSTAVSAAGAGGGLGVGTLTGIAVGGAVSGVLIVDELEGDDEPEPPASPTGGG